MSFASVGTNFVIHEWNGQDIENLFTYQPEKGGKLTNMHWCNDNSYVSILQENESPLILSTKDVNNVYLIHSITAFENTTAIAFKHSTKRNLAIGTSNGEVAIYDTRIRSINKMLPRLSHPVKELEFNSIDQQLGVIFNDSLVIFTDVNESDVSNEFKLPAKCTALKFHPVQENLVAVGCDTGYVVVWDTSRAEKVKYYQRHSGAITALSLSPCGKYLVTGGNDYKLCIIDNIVGECLFRMNLHQSVSALDISLDSELLAIGLDDGNITLYDIKSPIEPKSNLKVHNSAVNKIKFKNGPLPTFVESFDEKLVSSMGTIDIEEKEPLDNESTESICHTQFEVQFDKPKLETCKNDDFEKTKREMLKMVKTHMDDLESQLAEHCSKFQSYVNNEFESIHNTINERWNIFNNADEYEVNAVIMGAKDKRK